MVGAHHSQQSSLKPSLSDFSFSRSHPLSLWICVRDIQRPLLVARREKGRGCVSVCVCGGRTREGEHVVIKMLRQDRGSSG